MTGHPVSEEAAKSSHERTDSRSSNFDWQHRAHFQPIPNLTESSTFGPAAHGDPYANAAGNTGSVNEGLGSLNRWSQSTASSRGPSNHHAGHGRGGSAVSGYGVYGDPDSPKGPPNPGANTICGQLDQAFGFSTTRAQSQDNDGPQRLQTSKLADAPTVTLPESAASPPSPTNTGGLIHSQSDLEPTGSSAGNLIQGYWREQYDPEMDMDQHNAVTDPGSRAPQSHNRDISEGASIGEDLSSFVDEENDQGKRYRSHSQKAMLSRALQKANTAVLLDNAANFEGAMSAYTDACQLLQLVMLRSNGGTGEKLKLQEIRDTYMIRINELEGMELSYVEPESKALPERPVSDESSDDPFQPLDGGDRRASADDTSSLHTGTHLSQTMSEEPRALDPGQIPPRRQSLLPSPLDDELHFMGVSPKSKAVPDHGWPGSLSQPQQGPHLQPTLLPARTLSPEASTGEAHAPIGSQYQSSLLSATARDANESTSWLDTIDESGASSSSPHSQASSLYLRRRKSNHWSHGTESEFDAALDAAVEAAYDEGLEPAAAVGGDDSDDDIVANARRNVELAKQKVREAEREAAMAMAGGRIPGQGAVEHSKHASDYLDEESEEEERLLEEMTKGYVMDDFEFGLQSKSALPRQSDSSGVSGATRETSASNPEAAGVALSTLVEDDALSSASADIDPTAHSSVASTLPSLPTASSNTSVPPKPDLAGDSGFAPGVRARRLSGQDLKELRVETGSRGTADSGTFGPDLSPHPFAVPPPPVPKDEPQASYKRRDASVGSITEASSATSNLSKAPAQEDEQGYANFPPTARPMGKVPSVPDNLGKRKPSLSAMRARNGSVPIPDSMGDSPNTPSSSAFPTLPTAGTIPGLPTSTSSGFCPDGLSSGGLNLFDSYIHSPTNLGSPNPAAPNPPLPLEPCPESFLLRPFWLLRSIYQSISHPCGGYLSTNLFIPRDIWRVRNVKLKAVEEKISNCDLLTAALLKLAQVDTFDADAVLEEMQSLESVLDQVQASLSKKLGSDVGVQGAMPLFKLFPASDDASAANDTLPSKASNGPSGKSYLTSWRKLRSKNSGTGAPSSTATSKETNKDNLTINSVPMSSSPSSQPAKRDVMQLQVSGPNSHYMGALARLCDAAQVIDQIAQQVEDPGLKHSSPTLVGLELSTRHAAEFFGFYVSRFILIDIAMMLDKFVKRGSEWVLS